ncbi:hypothetical protein SLA2020_403900 [Shorea laevis]
MDREQEDLRFLGFFGICKESFKIIFSWRKIFSQSLWLSSSHSPSSSLPTLQISQLIFFNILDHEYSRDQTQKNTTNYAKLSDHISSEWDAFWAFKAAYFTIVLISLYFPPPPLFTPSPPSTRPKKSPSRSFVGFSAFGVAIFVLLLIFYLIGSVYITIVWHLASVVSVLEDVYGFKAMIKSRVLIKGIAAVFEIFVVLGMVPGLGIRILVGILCCLFLFKVILFGLVVQTVIYFVCKSYHHENIDKSSLKYHLGVYLGEYVPLKEKDVQLGTYMCS